MPCSGTSPGKWASASSSGRQSVRSGAAATAASRCSVNERPRRQRGAPMAENDERDDLEEQDEYEQDDDGGGEPQDSGDGGLVEGLMSRLGENGRSALKPVASAAAVAAATYVAKNGPQMLKDFGSDKTKEKLGQAHEKGGGTGFAAGAAKRALSSSGGNLVERLKQGGEAEAK